MPNVAVTRAEPIDAGPVGEVFDLYRQFYGADPDVDASIHFIAERLRAKDAAIFVARIEGTPSSRADGFMQLFPKLSTARMRRDWILNDLYVRDDVRRKGVAKALMREAVAWAKRTGAGRLSLKTQVHNASARKLYERLGWRLEEEFVTYLRDV
ncbi:MAG: GNAT family N-acetyltransferase [Phycisphaerales bacterium]|nr:GNAT family N-acetyltransferase [Phycisphaerales bacterium]